MATDDNGNNKLTGISQISRLKDLIQKWQSVTISSKATSSHTVQCPNGGIKYCDSDEESCPSSDPLPPDVPEGYLAVYVGPELRRFIIPTSYLSHSLFKVLLEKVEEEFGFDHSGGLTIPCEIETFKYLLNCMERHLKDHQDDDSAASSLIIAE